MWMARTARDRIAEQGGADGALAARGGHVDGSASVHGGGELERASLPKQVACRAEHSASDRAGKPL